MPLGSLVVRRVVSCDVAITVNVCWEFLSVALLDSRGAEQTQRKVA